MVNGWWCRVRTVPPVDAVPATMSIQKFGTLVTAVRAREMRNVSSEFSVCHHQIAFLGKKHEIISLLILSRYSS